MSMPMGKLADIPLKDEFIETRKYYNGENFD